MADYLDNNMHVDSKSDNDLLTAHQDVDLSGKQHLSDGRHDITQELKDTLSRASKDASQPNEPENEEVLSKINSKVSQALDASLTRAYTDLSNSIIPIKDEFKSKISFKLIALAFIFIMCFPSLLFLVGFYIRDCNMYSDWNEVTAKTQFIGCHSTRSGNNRTTVCEANATYVYNGYTYENINVSVDKNCSTERVLLVNPNDPKKVTDLELYLHNLKAIKIVMIVMFSISFAAIIGIAVLVFNSRKSRKDSLSASQRNM